MFSFSIDNMPMTFTGQALLAGANSFILNPPNRGLQGNCVFIGKAMRGIARTIYMLVIGFIIAPLGAIYHTLATLRYGIHWTVATTENKPRLAAHTWEHFKAAFHDVTAIACLMTTDFISKPSQSVAAWCSSTSIPISSIYKEPGIDYEDDPIFEKASLNYKYQFDMLVHAALYARENVGYTPQLNHLNVMIATWMLVSDGCYAKGSIPAQIDPKGWTYVRNPAEGKVGFQRPVNT